MKSEEKQDEEEEESSEEELITLFSISVSVNLIVGVI